MFKNSDQLFFFYKYDFSKSFEIDDSLDCVFFKPTLFKLKIHQGSLLLYLFWYFFTLGKYQVFYIFEGDKVVHFSNILPKIFKYSFMNKNDIQVANCYTAPMFRGKRLFPFALSVIGDKFKNTDVWVGAREDNLASIKGIKRAGYRMVARVYKTKFLGIYKLTEDE